MTPSTLARPLVLFGLLTAACGEDEKSGALTLEYELGPGLGCADASLDIGGLGAVEEIRVSLIRGNDEPITETADCLEGDTILLADAPAGNYELLVEGLDAVGDTVMDNLKVPETDERVEVIGGTSQNVSVNLAPTPARIEVAFDVNVGGFDAQCSADTTEVQFFDVTAYRGSTPMIMHQFDLCTTAGYNAVDDPDRVIEGALLNSIKIEVLGKSQEEIADLAPLTFPAPGAGKLVQLVVTCNDRDCEAALTNQPAEGDEDDGGDATGG